MMNSQRALQIFQKVFILTCFIVYINSIVHHENDKPSFLFQAEAGSKSSKSAKTTVIAIDGGGGGGKAHPMPVPWPVVHCHHHHHHLKYVPKPVLIHHWVKKEKPYEFAASEHLPYEGSSNGGGIGHLIDNLSQDQIYDFGAASEERKRLYNPQELNQQKHQAIISAQSINDNPSIVSNKYATSNKIQFDQELKRRLHHRLANDKLLQQRLKAMQNSQLKANYSNQSSSSSSSLKGDDADSDDSFKNILHSTTNATELSNYHQQQNGSNTIHESSSNNQGFISNLETNLANEFGKLIMMPGKPSHPFDETHGDQIRDESQQSTNSLQYNSQAQLAEDLRLLANLNQREESQAAKLFEKFSIDKSEKIQALNSLNQARIPLIQMYHHQNPSILMQNKQPIQMYNFQQKQTGLFNPVMSARVASSISESNTINTMTKLAEEAAKQEAKIMLNKKRANEKQLTNNHNSQPINQNSNKSSLISKLTSTIRNYAQRDKRRMAKKQFSDNIANGLVKPRSMQTANKSLMIIGQQDQVSFVVPSLNENKPIKLFNLQPRQQYPSTLDWSSKQNTIYGSAPSSNLASSRPNTSSSSIMSKVVNAPILSMPMEQLLSQSSSSVNTLALAEPNSEKKDTLNQLKSNLKLEQVPPRVAGNNTMNLEQESGFYKGQKEHLQTKEPSRVMWYNSNQNPDESRVTSINVTSPKQQSVNFLTGNIQKFSNADYNKEDGAFTMNRNIANMAPEMFASNVFPLKINKLDVEKPELVRESIIYGSREQHQNAVPIQMIPSNNQMLLASQEPNQQTSSEFNPDQGSYLEFPISPQRWSSEALKSINNQDNSNNNNNDDNNNKYSEDNKASVSQGYDESQSSENADNSNNVDFSSQQQNNQQVEDIISANNVFQLNNNNNNNNFQQEIPLQMFQQNMFEQQPNMFPMDSTTSSVNLHHSMTSPVHLFPNYPRTNLINNNYYRPQYVYPSSSSFEPSYMSVMTNKPNSPYSPYTMPLPSMINEFANPPQTQLMESGPSTTGNQFELNKPFMNGVASSLMASSVNNKLDFNQNMDPLGAMGGGLNSLSVAQSPATQNKLNTLESAKNDISTLRQFQNTLSQASAFGPSNFTTMTRLAGNLRTMGNMQNNGQRGLPQIPNIPQPPQPPNIPMPPPGMMQMAGLALPFAMARATRNRNRQINSAANGGGSSTTTTGQRLLQGATSFTNRLINRRRRPSVRPSSQNSFTVRPNRNRRYFGLVQTVLDMSRRPPIPIVSSSISSSKLSSGAASAVTTTLVGAAKMKPKMDSTATYESKAKRFGRSVKLQHQQQQQHQKLHSISSQTSNPIMLPSSVLTTLTDGSMSAFSSMNSPMDLLADQINHLKALHQERRRAALNQAKPSLSNINEIPNMQPKYELIVQQPTDLTSTMPHLSQNGLKLIGGTPLLAHNINLLLFSAQNVTGGRADLNKYHQQEHTNSYDSQDPQEPSNISNEQHQPAEVETQKQPFESENGASNELVREQHQESSQPGNQQQQGQQQDQLTQLDSAEKHEDIFRQQVVVDEQATSKKELKRVSGDKRPLDLQRPSESKWTQVSSIQTTRSPKLTSQTIPQSNATTSSISTTTTTTTTTTTSTPASLEANEDVRLEPQADQTTAPDWKVKLKKSSKGIPGESLPKKSVTKSVLKRSTTTSSPTSTRNPVKRSSSAFPNVIFEPKEDGFDENIDEDSTIASADYVRAIKLVRGVAYPWPPPTKSSKVSLEDTLN